MPTTNRNPLYMIWWHMKGRCYRKEHHDYPRFGGKGIGVHAEWRDDFDAFGRYVGKRPPGAKLYRIDTSNDYVPGNLQWGWRTHASLEARARAATKEILEGVSQPLGAWYARERT